MNMFDLKDRVILLTGAAGHLGAATSQYILASGAELVAVGRRESALLALKEALSPELRSRCNIITCDVTREDTPAYIKSAIESQFGRLHGIVNNAYAGKVAGTIEFINSDDFYAAYSNSVVAPYLLIKALLPLLEATAKESNCTTSIVNVSSMYGTVSPDPSIYGDSGKNNPIHYGASKAGMIQLTRYLACHLGNRGVRVNSVAPGPFPRTELDPGIPDFYASLARKVPMGRVGVAREVAGPILFLLSDAASYVNGVNLPIDGGWTAW